MADILLPAQHPRRLPAVTAPLFSFLEYSLGGTANHGAPAHFHPHSLAWGWTGGPNDVRRTPTGIRGEA